MERAAELADSERPRRLGELKALEHTLAEREQLRERYLSAFERGTLSDRDCGTRVRTLGEEIARLKRAEASWPIRSRRLLRLCWTGMRSKSSPRFS